MPRTSAKPLTHSSLWQTKAWSRRKRVSLASTLNRPINSPARAGERMGLAQEVVSQRRQAESFLVFGAARVEGMASISLIYKYTNQCNGEKQEQSRAPGGDTRISKRFSPANQDSNFQTVPPYGLDAVSECDVSLQLWPFSVARSKLVRSG